MAIGVGDELRRIEWRFVESALQQERSHWVKRAWMNGVPMWLKAYPKQPVAKSRVMTHAA
jgi:hypothetical protein